LLEEIYLVDDFIWSIVSTIIHHHDNALENGAKDDFGMGDQLVGYFLSAFIQ
jgi:hypothetical protein